MNSQAKNAVYVLLIGVVLMVIGQAWALVAESNYRSGMKDEITAYDQGDSTDYINALWDEYEAQNSMFLASDVFSIGMIVAVLGIAVLVWGMIPPRPVLVQQVYAQPQYPPGYQVMQAPPTQPGYQEPPRQ
jgi:hypothetical protein